MKILSHFLVIIFTCSFFSNSFGQHHVMEFLVFYPKADNITAREMTEKIDYLVKSSNKIYENSGVNIRLKNIGIEVVNESKEVFSEFAYQAINNGNLSNFNSPSNRSKFKNEISKYTNRKKQTRADFVLVVDYKETSGAANSGNKTGGPYNAYIRMNFNDVKDGIFLHELGHLQGLTHEMGATIPYNNTSDGFRSVMAVNTVSANKATPNLFSGKSIRVENTKLYDSCNWDAVTILNKNAKTYSNWGNLSATSLVSLRKVPGARIDISYANDCHVWVIDNKNELWQWNGFQWEFYNRDKSFIFCSARSSDKVYLIDENYDLYSYEKDDNKLKAYDKPEKILKISANKDGKKWMLGQSGYVYQRKDSKWKKREHRKGKLFIDVAVESKKKAWGITRDGEVYKWDGDKWKSKTNIKCVGVSVGEDGTVGLIAQNKDIYIKYPGGEFQKIQNSIPSYKCNNTNNRHQLAYCASIINAGKANVIDIYNKDKIWALSNNYTYKYVQKSGFLRVYEYGEIHKKYH